MIWSSWINILLRLSICQGLFFVLGFNFVVDAAEPMSWSRFDGPQHNRISRESNLDLEWPKGEQAISNSQNLQLWTLRQLTGNSTPLVFNNKLYLASMPDTKDKQKNIPPASSFLISCWNIKERDPEFVYQYKMLGLAKTDSPSSGKTLLSVERKLEPLLVGDPLLRQLFCLTWQGELHTLDGDLGHLLWKKSLSEIVGQKSTPVSIATPLIFEQCLVIPASWYDSKKQSTTNWLLALDRRNGQVIWAIQNKQNSLPEKLPAPVSAVYQGQVVVAAQLAPGELRLIQIRTGKQVAQWKLSDKNAIVRELLFESEQLAVLSRSPVTNNNKTKLAQWWLDLFPLPAARNSSADLNEKLSPKTTTQIRLADSHHTTALLHAGRLFVINAEGVLREYQASTGKILAETNPAALPISPRSAEVKNAPTIPEASTKNKEETQLPTIHQLVFANQQLLVTSTAGLWCGLGLDQIIADEKAALKIQFRQQIDGVLAIPVISKGRIYVRSLEKITAIGPIDNIVAVSSIIEPLTILAKEKVSTTPGMILITPGLQELKPGWKQKFQVQLFNTRGAFLRTLNPEELRWSDPVLGKIEKKSGTYFAPQTVSKNNSRERLDQIKVQFESFSAHATVRVRN